MKWYIGQPIVAIRNHTKGKFKKGDEFTIKGLRTSNCYCPETEIDIGFLKEFNISSCPSCKKEWVENTNQSWFSEKSFAPLDVDISELTEILTQKETA